MSEWLIHHELERQAAWNPSNVMLRFEGNSWTYDEFNCRVNTIARGLRSIGLEKGDTVVPHSKNHPDLYALFLACSKAGMIYSPISTFQSERNIEYICEEIGPGLVCYTDDEGIGETLDTIRANATNAEYLCLDPTADTSDYSLEAMRSGHDNTNLSVDLPDGQATRHNIFWTSGTTGRPKAVVRNHCSSLNFSNPLTEVLPFDEEMRRLIHNDMMFVAPYLSEGLPTIIGGGTLSMVREFAVEQLVDVLQGHDITDIHLAFTKTKLVVEYAEEKGISLRIPRTQASLPNEEIARKLVDMSETLYHSYATTEVGRPLVEPVEPPFDGRPSIGKPGRSADVRLVTDDDPRSVPPHTVPKPGASGEIAVKGDITMTRYLLDENQERLVHDGWVYTGDMGKRSEDGKVVFMGRKDDRIRTGGINVYPAEIENVITDHPDVEETAVVGVEDELWGQRVCCLVVTDRDDFETFEGELDEHYRQTDELAGEVRPKEYAFLSPPAEVPTSAVNKVDRREVKSYFYE